MWRIRHKTQLRKRLIRVFNGYERTVDNDGRILAVKFDENGYWEMVYTPEHESRFPVIPAELLWSNFNHAIYDMTIHDVSKNITKAFNSLEEVVNTFYGEEG